MTAAGEPIPPITDATLTDIAANGLWGPGHTVNQSVVDVSRALLAGLQGAPGVELPSELTELVAEVRRRTVIESPGVAGSDDIRLSALAIKQRDGEPHPAVIMPAGWNPLGWLPFVFSSATLALRGYHVLAYTPRGLGFAGLPFTSEGFIDVAGPDDWADGSKVIDYAEDCFAPSRIGFLGESYGSGIGQLVAAHDRADRVSAVVALSTWGNLATSLYDHGTRHIEAVQTLIDLAGGPMEKKFDEETQQVLKDFLGGQNLDAVVAWGERRSPQSYVDATNERGIPTFISNTWHETLFPLASVVDTFDRLTVPKRLNVWIGDHGAPEGPGMTGLLSSAPFPGLWEPIREAYDWLDHHLLGKDNGVPDWPEVNNQIMFTYRTSPIPGGTHLITEPARREPHASWGDVTTGCEPWYLTGANGSGDGALSDKPASGWSRDFIAGNLTEATAGVLLETGQQEWFGNPRPYEVAKFDRSQLLVWSTDPLTGRDGVARRIRGAAAVHLTVRSSAEATTLVAYLYDVDPDGIARIIAHEPYTASGLTPNVNSAIGWRLQTTAYDLPAGHRLALVVNSRDPLYSCASVDGSTTTVSSPNGSEARLELPLG
ncbi:CocE/NonD family hydrolase [Streptomyces sp. PTD5-9]|uniref:CocE/NonD family hydrolase n=1 Tax=Streptomyces sp. PTD5-9 TaxID=3120150 RepID=UPI00300B181F